jgi:hypothetical protein
MPAARRPVAAIVFWLGLAISLGEALAQSNVAQMSRLKDQPTAFQIWRTITVGLHDGAHAYREALDAARMKVGDAADEILGRPGFPYARIITEIELVLLSVIELGLDPPTSLSGVYERAKQLGLELCPAEVGPQLRLDYRSQLPNEVLHIAMAPVATHGGEPTILALMNIGGVLSLVGSDGRSDFTVPQTFLFAFGLPQREALTAFGDPR